MTGNVAMLFAAKLKWLPLAAAWLLADGIATEGFAVSQNTMLVVSAALGLSAAVWRAIKWLKEQITDESEKQRRETDRQLKQLREDQEKALKHHNDMVLLMLKAQNESSEAQSKLTASQFKNLEELMRIRHREEKLRSSAGEPK